MPYGLRIYKGNGAILYDTTEKFINVVGTFFVPAGATITQVYTDPTLLSLVNSGVITMVGYEIIYGKYPLSLAPEKKTISISSGPNITVSVSGGNMSARVLVVTK